MNPDGSYSKIDPNNLDTYQDKDGRTCTVISSGKKSTVVHKNNLERMLEQREENAKRSKGAKRAFNKSWRRKQRKKGLLGR